VPAQGANNIIVPIQVSAQMIYGTTPYATEGEVDIFSGGSRHCFALPSDDAFLFGTVSRTVNAAPILTTSATQTQYIANSPLTLEMQGGNPTAGNSTIVLRGLFYVITL
jgi:hypothetical protein